MLGYHNGSWGKEVTVFGVTFFWRHKRFLPIAGDKHIGRLHWERF